MSVDEVLRLSPDAIIVSPGPCTPREAGMSEELIRRAKGSVPLLGVCLGHQAICSALGGDVVRAPRPVHGQTSRIRHAGRNLFAGLPNPLTVMRYHSLMIQESTLPDELRVTAWTSDGIPMAIEHREFPLFGVQFHPESILTDSGQRLLASFLTAAGHEVREPGASEISGQVDRSLWEQPFEQRA